MAAATAVDAVKESGESKKTYAVLESGFVPRGLSGLKLWETMGPLIDAHCGTITGHTRISVTALTYMGRRKDAPPTTPLKLIQGLVFTTTPMSTRDAVICFAKGNPHVSALRSSMVLSDRWAVELQVNHLMGKKVDSTGFCISAIDRGGKTFAEDLKTAGKLTPDGGEAGFDSSAKQPNSAAAK